MWWGNELTAFAHGERVHFGEFGYVGTVGNRDVVERKCNLLLCFRHAS
jgi:hypothetical protein